MNEIKIIERDPLYVVSKSSVNPKTISKYDFPKDVKIQVSDPMFSERKTDVLPP